MIKLCRFNRLRPGDIIKQDSTDRTFIVWEKPVLMKLTKEISEMAITVRRRGDVIKKNRVLSFSAMKYFSFVRKYE